MTLGRITVTPSILALLVANIIPLIGVSFFSWSLFSVILLYWLENIVTGIYNVARMKRATGPVVADGQFKINNKPYGADMQGSLIGFFIMHYGLFTLVHGVFVFVLFGEGSVNPLILLLSLASLFISHGISYRLNFLGEKEYERLSASDLVMRPYKRIITLHMTIIVGGMLAQLFSTPLFSLVVLVVLKTGIDLYAHVREHDAFTGKPAFSVSI